MLDNTEEWKVIVDYPRYMISNQGRIKSLIGKEKLLQPFTTNKGYLSIKLSKKNTVKGQYITKSFKVHRLVAQHFCENFSQNIEVHHINRRRKDNRAENLICITKKEHLEIHKNESKKN